MSLHKKEILISILFGLMVLTCFGQFSPSPDYIANNKGKWSIETPEVQELVHIIIALTPTGKGDMNMVQHHSPYYLEVLEHFQQYENHAIIGRINQLLED